MPKAIATQKVHTPKIVEKRKLADGCLSFRCRCCGDESTDSWHTLYIAHDTQIAQTMKENPANANAPILGPEDITREHIKAELDAHKARVARLHDLAEAADRLSNEFIEVE